MPLLDGLTLCRLVKNEKLEIPVIVVSSMISDQTAHKCTQVGADAYLGKKNLDKLVSMLDQHCIRETA